MKPILLSYLVCPTCQQNLECVATILSNIDIEEGFLFCNICHKQVPIIRGIPRFVNDDQPLQGENINTAHAFGWEWQTFQVLHGLEQYKAQFFDWIYPIQSKFFEGKIILDAGCGMGRFSIVSSEFGAKTVFAVDASQAVDVAKQNLENYPNTHVIQADIHNLPFRTREDAQVDFIFSIGVLHHLDNPQQGFNDLIRHLKLSGSIFFWVYGRENNDWLVNIINPIRTQLTSRLPKSVLYVLSGLMTLGIHPILKLVYRPANDISALAWLKELLPYYDYLAWLGQFQFRHNHHVIFDHLVAPVAFYLHRQDIEK